MVKVKKGKTRLDKFYHLAKEHGFRSRAAFKLIQLNKKFEFLKDAHVLIDLCAAPGSWSQVASQIMPKPKTIVAVDLFPIPPILNAKTLVSDIMTVNCVHKLQKMVVQQADVVLNDGAPNVGVAWIQDAYGQAELVLAACKVATQFLKLGGVFVTKIFRSKEYTKLLWVLHQLFSRVTATKPPASRSVSAEIYVVCEGYLSPKKIDPRLLNTKYVFVEASDASVAKNVSQLVRAPKHASGYEEGRSVLYREESVSAFVHADDPIAMLSKCSKLVLDEERHAKHASTTDEVKACLEDLKVLGKRDFRQLLRWRLALLSAEGASNGEEVGEEAAPEDDEEAEAVLLREYGAYSQELKRHLRKKRRRARVSNAKRKRRLLATLETEEQCVDHLMHSGDLFDLNEAEEGEVDIEALPDVASDSESEASATGEEEVGMSELERKKHRELKLEGIFDHMYTEYLVKIRSNRRRAIEKLRSAAHADALFVHAPLEGEGSDGVDGRFEEPRGGDDVSGTISKLVKHCPPEDPGMTSQLWFSQGMFDEYDEDEQEEHELRRRLAEVTHVGSLDSSKPLTSMSRPNGSSRIGPVDTEASVSTSLCGPKSLSADDHADSEQGPSDSEDQADGSDSESTTTTTQGHPAPSDDDDSDAEEQDDGYTTDDKAEIMALAKKLSDPVQRSELLALTLSRHQFSDSHQLPDWFVDDEQMYNRPNPPITKEEFDRMKAHLKAINARCSKRIAEAQARRKRRFAKHLEKSKALALKVMEREELSEPAKRRQVERILSKTKAKFKPTKVYLVSGLGKKTHKSTQGRTRVRFVDKRLKKDKFLKQKRDKRSKK